MPLYQITGPDGHLYEIEGPEGASKEQIVAAVQAKLAGQPAGPQPQSGFIPAFKANAAGWQQSFANLGAEYGLRDAAGAARDIAALDQYKEQTFKPTDKSWREAPVSKFMETLGGALPSMAAPLAAGVVGGLPAAGLMSLAQFTGSNLERQREQGAQVGSANLGAATAAAVPQAALDLLSFKMIPGVRTIFGSLGKELTEEGAKAIAKQALGRKLTDYTMRTGVAAGAEGATEVAQQMMERLQAGMTINDPAARAEYVDALIGGAVLGGAVSVPGRMMERSKIKSTAAAAERREEAEREKERLAQEDAAAQQRLQQLQAPEYLTDLEQRYEALVQQHRDLRDAARKPQDADKSDLEGQRRRAEAREALNTFKETEEYRSIMREMEEARPYLDQFRKQRQRDAEGQASAQQFQQEAAQPVDQSPEGQQARAQAFAESLEPQIKAAKKAGDEREVARLEQQRQEVLAQAKPALPSYAEWRDLSTEIDRRIEAAQFRNKDLTDTGGDMQARMNAADNLARLTQARKRLDEIGQQIDVPVDQTEREAYLTKQARKATDLGANPQEYLKELQQLQQQPSLFDETANKSFENDQRLAQEMAAQRPDIPFEERQRRIDAEVQALQRIGDRRPTSPEYMDTLYRAMGFIDNFVPPSPPGGTLHLPPERQGLADKRLARRALRDMHQKSGERVPLDSWLAAKRAALIERGRHELSFEGPRPDDKQKTVPPARAGAQPGADEVLRDASDERVLDLIDRLLPRAAGSQTLTAPEPWEAMQRSLAGVPTTPPATTGNVMPPPAPASTEPYLIKGAPEAFPARRLLEKIRANEQRIKEINVLLKRAGNPKDPDKVAAKAELAAERAQLSDENDRLKKRYGEMEGYARPEQAPADMFAGPEPRETVSQPEPQPGQKGLPGIPAKPFRPKAPSAQEMAQARTALVNAQTQVEKLRKLVTQLGEAPKFLTETGKDTAGKKRNVQAKANAVETARARLETAQADVAKKRQAVEELEKRQRMAQRADAAERGVSVGELEGERIQRGEAPDYRNYKGKKIAPLQLPKVRASVAPVLRAQKAIDAARQKVAELDVRKAEPTALGKQFKAVIDAHYSEARRKEIRDELKALADKDILPIVAVEDRYSKATTFAEVQKLAKELTDADNKGKEALQRAHAAAEKAYSNWQFAKQVGAAAAEQERLARIDHTGKELVAERQAEYDRARANRLELERLVGDRLVEAYERDIRPIRNELNAQKMAASRELATAERVGEAERQAIRNAPKAAEAAAREAKFKAQEAASERKARAQTGLGLPGTRVERDTTLLEPAANVLKKSIARADNALSAALRAGNQRAAAAIQNKLDDLNRQLDQLYARATPTAKTIREEARSETTPSAGALPSRREGAMVRRKTGSKRALQSGAVRLTAENMDLGDANAISLYTLKSRMDAATGDAKARLEEMWKLATHGVSNVEALLKEGEKLVGLGPTARVIGARQRLLEAETRVAKLKSDSAQAGSEVEQAIAKQKLEDAQKERDAAKELYQQEFEDYRKAKAVKTAEEVQVDEIESAWVPVKTDTSRPDSPFAAIKAFNQSVKDQARRDKRAGKPAAFAKPASARAVEDIYNEGPDDTYARDESGVRTDVGYEEVEADPSAPFHGKTFADAARWGFANTKDPFERAMFTRLAKVFDSYSDTNKGRVWGGRWGAGDRADISRGFFNNTKNELLVEPGHPETVQTLLHELVHAATVRGMREDDWFATNLNFLWQDALQRWENQNPDAESLPYGLADPYEFVAEANSNPDFQLLLSEMPSAIPRVSLWDRFVQLVAKLLGMSSVPSRLTDVLQLTEGVFQEAERNQGFGPRASASPGRMSEIFYRTANPEYDVLIGRSKGAIQHAKDVGLSVTALARRVDLVDRFAGLEEATRRAEKAGKIKHADAVNAMYATRLSENTNQAVSRFIASGAVFIDKDGTFAVKKGTATLQKVFEHAGDGARALGVSPDEGNDILTVLATGQRAGAIPNGWEKLAGDNAKQVKALYDKKTAEIAGNAKAKASFDAALRTYKQYNDSLVDFLAQGGAISKAEAKRLQSMPYAPYYRIEGDSVRLIADNERPIVIGNIKSQPELQQMLGDDNKVLNTLDASVKNTYLIARMAMRNHQAQEIAKTLYRIGAVTKMGKGVGTASKDTMHYKVDGEDHFAIVDNDVFGVPAELIAKGLEGIKTTLPGFMRMMGGPAHLIRAAVTRMPTYALRQMMRDPINAVFTNGMDMRGIADAYKNIGQAITGKNEAEEKLMDALVVTSNIHANDPGDIVQLIRQAQKGSSNAWNGLLLKMDELAQSADAATRTAIYDDSVRKGMSHMEASLRALESMNFNRRGLSPSMHMLSTIVPFFNAQVQGLDVLYRALRGKMPLEEKLNIRKKLWARAALLAGASMAYAMAMHEDEDYRKLRPQDRYQNFLIRTPFTKDYVKIPIPYEVGLLFKALPEAIMDVAYTDTKASDAAAGMAYLANNAIPKPWNVAAISPVVMAFFNNTGFGPIETNREKAMAPELRYRDTTPETLKAMSQALNAAGIPLSPLMLEHFLRSYLGAVTVSATRVAMDPAVMEMMGTAAIQRPTGGEADMPFFGGLFGRTDGRALVDRAYDRMEEILRAKATYDELVRQGARAEARQYAQDKSDELAMADLAGAFRQSVGATFSDERAIRMNRKMTTEQKDRIIERIKKARNAQAEAFYAAAEKRTRPPGRP